ncbi:MAG: metallophosphoesterase [Gammaproteobacteria bacterium]|nr:metallophosphoesterase [Gammaproteobacteria bacterium]MCP5426112.1 metallophosphoesterase [Gammaproteobacteria bacterium]MCP5460003.1 metallophosphoesterase [Gammaproteobacteria bacterium]
MHLVSLFQKILSTAILSFTASTVYCAKNIPIHEDKTSLPSIAHYAYSLLAPSKEGGVLIYARIVFDSIDVACPLLTGSDHSKVVTQKRPFTPGAPLPNINFPVTVCEAVIAENTAYQGDSGDIDLAAVTLSPSEIQVYGDSGCESESHCQGTQSSPYFELLAKEGAKRKADLILHMGDYNYRGTAGFITETTDAKGDKHKIWAYDAGDGTPRDRGCGLTSTYYSQNASNSPRPDNWQSWRYDFFEPTKELLPKAPWVFARGNHELCSRGGPAWFYFMGPGSSLKGGVARTQCPDQGDFNNPPTNATHRIVLLPPYRLDLHPVQLWIMDSANACDGYADNALTTQYRDQYEQINKSSTNKMAWIVTHRPLWGFVEADFPTLNQTLQAALSKTTAGQLPASVDLLLAGHLHLFESLTSLGESPLPPQLIVGNSGVRLEAQPSQNDFSITVDGHSIQGHALRQYGFLHISLDNDGAWQGKMFGLGNATILTCDSGNPENEKTLCEIASSAAQKPKQP